MGPFTPYQLFNLKVQTVEKRLENYYQETHDTDLVVRVAACLQIRDNLAAESAAVPPAKALIRRLRQSGCLRPTPWVLRLIRRLRQYFSILEWRAFLHTIASFYRQNLQSCLNLLPKAAVFALPFASAKCRFNGEYFWQFFNAVTKSRLKMCRMILAENALGRTPMPRSFGQSAVLQTTIMLF